VPLFEKKEIIRPIVTHWRAKVLIQYYGVRSPFLLVDELGDCLRLPSGRELRFLHTPYLHFPGAIATYDALSGTLFSSDLFGAFFIDEELRELFAGPRYMEAMKTFHEHYMPGNEHIRPIMEMFLNLSIRQIAPQHGSIIRERIPAHIRALRDLECGSFLRPIKKQRAMEQGYVGICNEILRRCFGIAGQKNTIDVFEGTDIVVDPHTGEITDFSTSGEQLWHTLFRIIQNKRGIGWLSALEVLARTLSEQYSIPLPDAYASSLVDIAKQAETLGAQYREAKALSEQLSRTIDQTRDQLTHDATSGLYNAQFFMRYLQNELSKCADKPGAFLLISIDNLQRINFRHGAVKGDDTARGCGWLIGEHLSESMMLSRLEGANFGVYMPGATSESAKNWAEALRVAVAKSDIFIESVTVSIGVVHSSQAPDPNETAAERIQFYFGTAGKRVRIAKNRGANYVCSESSSQEFVETFGSVLLVDTDNVHVDILSTMLAQMELAVQVAGSGEEALAVIERGAPDIIISEILVPKIDGFGIRERLLDSSKLKAIPFILVSPLKDEPSIARAHRLDIIHYFKKPYLLSELIGVVKALLRGAAVR
jgi:diguanylate cyclase (GGDEF)-like protein